uniref:Nitric oxide synthase-interacting protein n=2 Tax=Sus scrofa TaxID=9823 RepID=A0A8D1Q712_PIG
MQSRTLTAAASLCSPATTPSSRHSKGLAVPSQEPGRGQSLGGKVQGVDKPGLLRSPFTARDFSYTSEHVTKPGKEFPGGLAVEDSAWSLLWPSPDGYLYEREAILEYILHQKKEIARQMKAYEKQRGARREEQKELQRAAAQDQVRGFLEKEAAIVSRPLNPFTPKAASGDSPDDAQPGPSAGPAGKDKDKALPSFWIPSLTPEAKATKLEKPSRVVTCPMSGKPLRMSDLTPVRFTPLDSSVDRVGLITRSERYVCAVTRDSLSNATPCAVLRPSGAVVTLECVEKLIRKDMVDPVNGEKLTDRDIIVLQRGGTGFAGSGVKLQAEKSRPVMQA